MNVLKIVLSFFLLFLFIGIAMSFGIALGKVIIWWMGVNLKWAN
jgi:hypothetical protein